MQGEGGLARVLGEGHGVVLFDDLRLPASALLGEEGQAFRYAQLRLAPARLTHCMRWLGLAKRCLEEAHAYVNDRKAFGARLADRESVQLMMADVARDIHTGRLLTMHAAWKLDTGDKEYRYYLVWITKLPPGKESVEISEVLLYR